MIRRTSATAFTLSFGLFASTVPVFAQSEASAELTAIDPASSDSAASSPEVEAKVTEKTALADSTASAPAAEPLMTPPPSTEFPPSGTSQAAPSVEVSTQEAAARAAFQKGDRLYLEGDYLGAVHAFEQAYALSGRIEMLFNLANAHERLGNYSEASVALRGYIPHSPESQRAALEKRLARFEALAAQKEQATLKAETAARDFPVDRAVGIGLLTLGGAGLVTGTVFAISAANTRSELSDVCQEGQNGQLCPADAETLLDRDKTYSLVADISFIVGAAMAASGLYLVVRSGGEGGGEVRASVLPGGFLLGGSF